ncbi:unnamed protein product [Closterium sp. NIES-53]
MPAKATLFDNRCKPLFDFGSGPRNLVRWSPHSRSPMALARATWFAGAPMADHACTVAHMVVYARQPLCVPFRTFPKRISPSSSLLMAFACLHLCLRPPFLSRKSFVLRDSAIFPVML